MRNSVGAKPVSGRFSRLMKIGISALCCLVLVGIAAAAKPFVEKWLKGPAQQASDGAAKDKGAFPVPGDPQSLRLSEEVVQRLGIKVEPVQKAVPPEPLKLPGSLFLDPSKLAHVRSRFAGEVVELGVVEGMPDDPVRQPYLVKREVRVGDTVKKNELLAVLWSKDLGEKKSELVDALSRLWLDEETAERLDVLFREGTIPERALREAQQKVEADRIAVQKARRTLESWRVSDAEIDAVEAEARRIRDEARIYREKGKAKTAAGSRKAPDNWAKVEIRAPDFDGIVLEMNARYGDVINDNTLDLFKIADLAKLRVAANVFEEDVPELEKLLPGQRTWKIRLAAMPEGQFLTGAFDQIGHIIDPNQKTALVKGWVDNTDGTLRLGQTVTALVELPPPSNCVTVPISALVDDGPSCRVFVQAKADQPCYTAREVTVTGRVGHLAYLRSGSVEAGARVVVSGAVEMAAALEELQKSTNSSPTSLP